MTIPPPVNPNAEGIIGWWYAEYNQKGAFSEEEQDAYYKVVQGACFNEDGTGLWVEVYLNTAEEIVMPTNRIGSFAAQFDYTIAPDGTVNFDITDLKPIDISDLNPDKWSMKFTGKEIIGKEAGTDFTLTPITNEQQKRLSGWMTWLIGGSDEGAITKYNINNDTKLQNITPFTRDNWDDKKTIIIRTAYSVDDDIVDSNGKKGYRSIVLPWAKDENDNEISTVSQLPNGFCKNLSRENDWELVANYCGRFSYIDANYIVLYNKYTGILRYFYYIPEGTNLNDTNDHNWEIQMNDGTAEHTIFGYALPIDKKLTPDDGKKIGARNAGYWSQFVTPWTATANQFGNLVPNSGWYAFDVDLSVYRGEGIDNPTSMKSDRHIKPLLRGYAKDNITLYGSIKADITGSIDLEKCCVNNSGGVFGPFEDVLSNMKDIKEFIGNAKDLYGKVASGDFIGALEGGISVAKQGCDLAGIDYGNEQSSFDGYKGTVNMKLSGTIDMKGAIEGSRVISAPNSIIQSMADYDFGGTEYKTHLGEGVWNLSTSPVVYYTNAQISWQEEYEVGTWNVLWDSGTVMEVTWTCHPGPFGFWKKVAHDSLGETHVDEDRMKGPWCGYVSYFDPSSIKVELNPKLFTQKEIENAKVYATCGVRKVKSEFGSLDKYRDALGYKGGSMFDIKMDKGGYYTNRMYDEPPFDAMNNVEENLKQGKITAWFKTSEYDGHECGMFGLVGSGANNNPDYILEPQPLSGDDHPLRTYMPSYEVTVTVIVEREDGHTIVYSRNYLPEYKEMKVADMPEPTDKYIEDSRPANYAPAVFAQQMGHYRDVYNWTRRTLQRYEGQSLAYSDDYWIFEDLDYDDDQTAWPNLIDGNIHTKWRTIRKAREDHGVIHGPIGGMAWWASFQANYPVSPTGYSLTTTADNNQYSACRPRIWSVYGSNNGYDWTLLDSRSTAASGGVPTADALPHTKLTKVDYKFNKGKADNFKYYQLEIYQSWDDDDDSYMQIAEFGLNYD